MYRAKVLSRPRYDVALIFLAVALLLAASGCARTTPPGPSTAYGQFEGTGYLCYRWEQGLRIMIWHDAADTTSTGSGSTSDAAYRVEGRAVSRGGAPVEWTIGTSDGQTAQFTLDGVSYDLARGTLFLVRTNGSSAQVEQLDRDLSAVSLEQDVILAFAQGDPDIARFIEGARP
jgi:hypothetical protein